MALALGTAGSAVAQDPNGAGLTNLARVGTELARFNKPGALYGYVRDYHGTYFSVADKAGLALVLDGKLSHAEFKHNLQEAVASSALSEAEKQQVLAEQATVHHLLMALDG